MTATWEQQHIKRVETLSDQQVLKEVNRIMLGHNYSWYTISQRLQAKHNDKKLYLEHFEPGNVLYEWNVLCDERISWLRHKEPTFRSVKFNKTCLINLVLVPSAGLGLEG